MSARSGKFPQLRRTLLCCIVCIKTAKMGHNTCCVVNCKNTGRNNKGVKFYKFPAAIYKKNQRLQWIAAVKRVNVDGSAWMPNAWDTICSEHFVNNEKSNEELSPSYVPTIFPPIYKSRVRNPITAVNRYLRRKKKIVQAREKITTKREKVSPTKIIIPDDELHDSMMVVEPIESPKPFCDQECEAYFYIESNESSKTFVCNRYIYKENSVLTCEVEIQTDIIETSAPTTIINRKEHRNSGYDTDCKTFVNNFIGPDCERNELKSESFSDYESVVIKDEQLRYLHSGI